MPRRVNKRQMEDWMIICGVKLFSLIIFCNSCFIFNVHSDSTHSRITQIIPQTMMVHYKKNYWMTIYFGSLWSRILFHAILPVLVRMIKITLQIFIGIIHHWTECKYMYLMFPNRTINAINQQCIVLLLHGMRETNMRMILVANKLFKMHCLNIHPLVLIYAMNGLH